MPTVATAAVVSVYNFIHFFFWCRVSVCDVLCVERREEDKLNGICLMKKNTALSLLFIPVHVIFGACMCIITISGFLSVFQRTVESMSGKRRAPVVACEWQIVGGTHCDIILYYSSKAKCNGYK